MALHLSVPVTNLLDNKILTTIYIWIQVHLQVELLLACASHS